MNIFVSFVKNAGSYNLSTAVVSRVRRLRCARIVSLHNSFNMVSFWTQKRNQINRLIAPEKISFQANHTLGRAACV